MAPFHRFLTAALAGAEPFRRSDLESHHQSITTNTTVTSLLSYRPANDASNPLSATIANPIQDPTSNTPNEQMPTSVLTSPSPSPTKTLQKRQIFIGFGVVFVIIVIILGGYAAAAFAAGKVEARTKREREEEEREMKKEKEAQEHERKKEAEKRRKEKEIEDRKKQKDEERKKKENKAKTHEMVNTTPVEAVEANIPTAPSTPNLNDLKVPDQDAPNTTTRETSNLTSTDLSTDLSTREESNIKTAGKIDKALEKIAEKILAKSGIINPKRPKMAPETKKALFSKIAASTTMKHTTYPYTQRTLNLGKLRKDINLDTYVKDMHKILCGDEKLKAKLRGCRKNKARFDEAAGAFAVYAAQSEWYPDRNHTLYVFFSGERKGFWASVLKWKAKDALGRIFAEGSGWHEDVGGKALVHGGGL